MPTSTVSCGQVARDIAFHPKDRVQRFLALSHTDRAHVLLCLSKKTARSLLSELKPDAIVDLLEHLDPDDSADVLQLMSTKRQKSITAKLKRHKADQITFLAEFDAQTAAGLMSLEYLLIDEELTLKQAANRLKKHERHSGHFPVMLVMRNGALAGELPAYALALGTTKDEVRAFTHSIGTIDHDASRQDIVDTFRAGNHSRLVVLGEDGNVLGIIFADSLLRYLEEKSSQSLYSFAGIHKEESVLDPARTKVKYRSRWLILNLGTSFLAASIVSLFQQTISTYVLLAVYMPIVAGMGGNAGTQTLAILIRGIALGQIDLPTALPTLKRELTAGLLNGTLIAILVAAVVMFSSGDAMIAMILGIAMVVNLIVSAFFGTMVPLIMERLGKDPATSATIFITTATDVLGFLCFLGLATIILP